MRQNPSAFEQQPSPDSEKLPSPASGHLPSPTPEQPRFPILIVDPACPQYPDVIRLSDSQWDMMKNAFRSSKPPWRKRHRKGGRPPLHPRLCFDAILWHLASGLPWSCLPKEFGSPRTIQRRLNSWVEQDSLGTAWKRYLQHAPQDILDQWRRILRSRHRKRHGFWYWEMLGALRALSIGWSSCGLDATGRCA